jgi:hypothetical protein
VGKVTASLDTAHYKGPLQKVVTVRTNEAGAAPVMLELHAEITTLVDVTPSDTPVLQMIVGEPHPMELTMASSDGKPFDVLGVRTDGPLDVAVAAPPDAPRPKRSRRHAVASGSSRYVVRLTPKADAHVGRSVVPVTLTTSIRGAETVPVQLTLMVNGRVRVMPTFLSVRPAPEPPVLHVKVTTAATGGLEILGVESSDPDFTATTTPVAPGREYDVTIRYGGAPGRGAVAGRITVRTNEPGQEAIVIPLAGST